MQSKRIVITGANGQLGRELSRLGAVSPNEYIPTDINELDITNKEAVVQFLAEHKADVIVNCAAYTNVERAESEQNAAYEINSKAAANLAEAAKAMNATLIHISTDYVFGTEGNTPRTEDMPTSPLGVYGHSKLEGERAVIESGCKAIIIRTAWLYSEFGSNFLKTMLRLTAENEALSVVFDQIGTPTYAGDLALAIFSIIDRDVYEGREGLYHFSNEGACSWYDFATEIASAAGHECKIVPCHSREFPSKVTRPPYSVLDKSKFKSTFGIDIPHWRESMLYCLKRMGMLKAR